MPVDAQPGRERELTDALSEFTPVSLEDLDRAAALLRRVDNKYPVEWSQLIELLERLRPDHTVLEIDGRREFSYRSVYFDTPELRCFVDHVEDRAPRFKARTRVYADTGSCVFEVKLKPGEGETDKRQTDHPAERAEELTEEAMECLAEALGDAGLEAPEEMEPRLRTSFCRFTLASSSQPERLTCDFRLELSAPGGDAARLSSRWALVETKTEHGEGAADSVLADLGLEPVSLSKYRIGIGLLGPPPVEGPQPGSELFEQRSM